MSTENGGELGSGTEDDAPSQLALGQKDEDESGTQRPKSQNRVRISAKYFDNYQKLFDEATNHLINPHHHSVSEEELGTSHVGLSLWTGEHKESFFHALARYGEHDLPRLAAVTQKSEPEVGHYLNVLRLGLKELATIAPDKVAFEYSDIPAAIELSDECCTFLDHAADKLLTMEKEHDGEVEEEGFAESWLLDKNIADAIEVEIAPLSNTNSNRDGETEANENSTVQQRQFQSMSQGTEDSSILSSIPSASLLNLKSFLTLSESIFMNTRGPKHGWQPYVRNPGIYRSAFDDFHALATNLTRQLIHASVYQAMTRSRALDKRDRIPSSEHRVLREDIQAAVDMLGLERDSKEWWARLPRRFGLKCFVVKRKHGERGEGKRVVPRWVGESHVEKYLLGKGRVVEGEYRKMRQRHDGEEDDGSDSGIGDESTSVEGQECERETEGERPSKKRRLEDELAVENAETEYVEKLDQQVSRKGELDLWMMLDRDPPSTVKLHVGNIGDLRKRRPRNDSYVSD